MKEMASAAAVARTETGDGDVGSRQAGDYLGPQVLSRYGIRAEPDFPQRGCGPQIVDMPVQPAQRTEMAEAAGLQSAGSESAADVNIPAPGDPAVAKTSDPQLPRTRTGQQEGIGAARSRNFMRL